jgi:hypothetical protein
VLRGIEGGGLIWKLYTTSKQVVRGWCAIYDFVSPRRAIAWPVIVLQHGARYIHRDKEEMPYSNKW